jgi:flavin reductase (DIM6/NTAB) family NADH-FMN oxidoreductase RutF
LDARAFRDALGLFATGVAVAAAKHEEGVHAMTVNAVSSLSLDPMRVLFCPAKSASFSRVLDRVERYSLNFLRDEQRVLSTYFAGGRKHGAPPPFRFVDEQGVPRLEGSLTSLLCDRHEVLDGGDHWLVVLAVRRIHRGVEPHRPLIFYGGQYRELDSGRGVAAPDLTDPQDAPAFLYHHD